MNMFPQLRQWFFALSFVLIACNPGPGSGTERSLEPPDIYFQTDLLDPIKLTAVQSETIMEIVRHFSMPSKVETRKEIAGYKTGDFIVEGRRYHWQGKALYKKKARGEGWIVGLDDRLGRLSESYLQALGSPPYRTLSTNEWKTILSSLNPEGYSGTAPGP